MIVISDTEFEAKQKLYFALAEKEQVFVKNHNTIIELVVRERDITDKDIENGLTGEDVKREIFKYIDELF